MGKLLDVERTSVVLGREDLDVLIACRPENFTYISGVARNLECRFVREHTTYALLTRDGNAALIVPFFELETVLEETWVSDVSVFRQFADISVDAVSDQRRGESAEAVLAEKIRQLGAATGRIGFDEKYTPVKVFSLLREQLPQAEFVPATRVFDLLRQVKTGEEIARLAESANITADAYRAMWSVLHEGMTERELGQVAIEAFQRKGSPPLTFMNCGAGLRSSIEHLPPSDYVVRRGELIRFDMGVCYRGYHSDVGRTFVCGEPSAEQARIYERIFDTYRQVIGAMRPGVRGCDIYDVYREGMGELYFHFPLEWVGHSYGLEIHEAPYLGPKMKQELEPGMVFAVEIVLDFAGREGYHVEDPILITEQGNRRLIDLPNERLYVGSQKGSSL